MSVVSAIFRSIGSNNDIGLGAQIVLFILACIGVILWYLIRYDLISKLSSDKPDSTQKEPKEAFHYSYSDTNYHKGVDKTPSKTLEDSSYDTRGFTKYGIHKLTHTFYDPKDTTLTDIMGIDLTDMAPINILEHYMMRKDLTRMDLIKKATTKRLRQTWIQ